MVKNLPATQGTWVQSLGWEDPLKKEMAAHSSILAWEIPWTEEPGVLQSMGLQRIRHDWVTNTFTFSSERFLPWTQSEGRILVNGMCVPAEAGEPQGTGLPGVYGHVTSSDQ